VQAEKGRDMTYEHEYYGEANQDSHDYFAGFSDGSPQQLSTPPRKHNRRFALPHKLTRYILKNADATALAVYVAVGLHADTHTGECHPSRETLAHLIGLRDVRVVTRCIARLVGLGLLERRDMGFAKWELRVVHTDAERDYLVVDDRLLEWCIGQEYEWAYVKANLPLPLGPACGGCGITGFAVFAVLAAIGNRECKRQFATSMNAVAELSGFSRGTIDTRLRELANVGLIEIGTPPAFGKVAISIVRGVAATFAKNASLAEQPSQKTHPWPAQPFTKHASGAPEPSQKTHPYAPKPSQKTHPELYKTLEPTKAFEPELYKGKDCARKSGEREVPPLREFRDQDQDQDRHTAIATIATLAITGGQLAEAYRECYRLKVGAACPWDAGDEAACYRTIERLPAEWGRSEYERCLTNLFRSKNGAYTRKPSLVLRDLPRYIETRLNGYDRPLQWKDMDLSEQVEHACESGRKRTGAFHRREVADYETGADAVFENVVVGDDAEGVAEDVLAALAEEGRKAAQRAEQQQIAAKAADEKQRRDKIANEILLDEELASWQTWEAIASDDERWADEDTVRDRAVARDRADSGDHMARAELWNSGQEAMESAQFQATLAARLAETDEVRQQRKRQRLDKQRQHREWLVEREKREPKERKEKAKRDLAAWMARQAQSATDAVALQCQHGLFGAFNDDARTAA
jgi:Helix-turn-helix domain